MGGGGVRLWDLGRHFQGCRHLQCLSTPVMGGSGLTRALNSVGLQGFRFRWVPCSGVASAGDKWLQTCFCCLASWRCDPVS